MATVRTVRYITRPDLVRRETAAWKAACREVLQKYILPRTPKRTGAMRNSLEFKVTSAECDINAQFIAGVPYAYLYEFDEDWISSVTLHYPNTRAPFIQPGIEEAKSAGVFQKHLKAIVRG